MNYSRRSLPRGFSTLEMLIAMTVLILSISAVTLLFPGIQSGSVDSEQSTEALNLAQKLLEQEQSLARKDFKLVVATSTTEVLAPTTYTKTVEVIPIDYFTKKITATVTWSGMYTRSPKVQLSTIVNDFQNVIGGDTCDSTFPGDWASLLGLRTTNVLFGALSGLSDANGTYQLTGIDVYKKRLYATVSQSSAVTVGPNNASTAANDTSIGTVSWTNPVNGLASDNTYTTSSISSGQTTNYLKVSNLGFTIPTGATILGIQVDIERKGNSSTLTLKDSSVRLVHPDGTFSTTNKADTTTSWPTADAYKTYGSGSDVWGETGLSPAMVNNPNFGAVIAATTNAGSGSRTASIDHVRVTVTYTKQFYVVNVGNPTSPTYLGSLGQNTVGTGMNAVAVATSTINGSYAYVAMNSTASQVEVIDVSTNNPSVVSTYQIPSATSVANTIFYKDGYIYVGLANNSAGAEFYVIDVHNPASLPSPLGSYEVGAGVHSIFVKNGYAYLTTDDSTRELIVLNIQDLAHPAFYGSYDAPGASGSGQGRSVYTIGDTLYLGRYYSLTTSPATPEFVELSTAVATPSVLGSYDIGPSSSNPFGVYGIFANLTQAFVLTSSLSNGGKFQVMNVTNPTSMSIGSNVVLPNSGGGVALDCEWNPTDGKDYFYAASLPSSGTYQNKGSLTVITSQ